MMDENDVLIKILAARYGMGPRQARNFLAGLGEEAIARLTEDSAKEATPTEESKPSE